MRKFVAILEDNPDRSNAMLALLRERYSGFNVEVFENAPDMIDWMADHLESCLLICLDHDLGPNRLRDGSVFDPGTGRDVVNHLIGRTPVCPVIIHTTNAYAAPGMVGALTDFGWSISRVVPYDDDLWIREVWIDEVVRTLTR